MASLIDIGGIAQLGQLAQTQRRNDLYEQNSLLQAQQDALTARHQRGSALFKLADDERIRADPALSTTYLAAAGAEFGVPETVTRAGVERGQASLRKHLQGLKDQDQETAMNGLLELQISQGSKVAGEMVTGFQNVRKLSEYSANVEAMRTLQGARYEALHDKQSKIQAGELPYSQGIRHFTTMLYGTESKEFERIATAASKVSPQQGAHPRTIGAALAKHDPIVSQFGGQAYVKNAEAASDQAQKYATVVGQSEQALQLAEMGEPLPPGTTKRDLMERVETGRTMMDAYNSVATWANDPYNLTKLKDAKASQTLLVKKRAELETLKASTSQELIAIRQQARSFIESEAGLKHTVDTNTQKAGIELLQALDGKDVTDERAVNAALAAVTKPYAASGGIDVKELSAIVNNLKGTGTKIYNYDPKQSVAEAGKLANVIQSIGEIGEVRKLVVDPSGNVNRSTLFASALNLPFSKGRNVNVFVEKAVEIKLRAATGAAARPDEMKQYVRDFGPSVKDSDELIKYKLDALEDWMQTVADVTDPAGALRKRKENLLSPASVKMLNSDEYKRLRTIDPQASSLDLLTFLRGRKENP